MSGSGTLEQLAYELGQALGALEDVFDVANVQLLFAELGIDNPPDLSGDPLFAQELASAAQLAAALEPDIEAIVTASDNDDDNGVITGVVTLIAHVGELIDAVDVIANDLNRAGAGFADVQNLAATFVERVLGAAVVTYLENVHPFLRRILSLLTIADMQDLTLTLAGTPTAISRRELHLDRIPALFTNPMQPLGDEYGWGLVTFDGVALFKNLRDVLDATVVPSVADDADADGPAGLELFNILVRTTTDATPPGLEAALFIDIPASFEFTLAQLSDNWRLAFKIDGALDAGARLKLLPPATFEIVPPSGTISGNVGLSLVGQQADPSQPFILFGETGGSRLQALLVSFGLGAGIGWDAANNKATAGGEFEVQVQKGKLVIDTSKSDGFLKNILPKDGFTFDFNFDAGWNSAHGMFFKGSAGLELAFAINTSIGPLTLETAHLVLGVASDGLNLEASLDCDGTLGPISASVERIGVKLDLAFKRGNLGPVDLGVAFRPPTGLGINISAGPITGGGFIEFDPDAGRYAGVLALSLYSIQIKAIGLLDTKLPDGEPGYSFLIIITVEFTPIQLGFGITLNGVGGLCGIHRDFIADAIQAGLRAHSLDHILFPKDPVKNAPAIISDLRTIFPPADGRYVFGPMLEIGWGGGLNLVTAELGVVLSVPSPVIIAILGQLNVNIPSPDAALIELHLDVLGIIDFGKKLFSLDASLHDSRIVLFTIYGDMALRLSWGDNPSFAFSVGGLNPHFQPPDGFPQLKRLTIALSASDEFRLTIQTYFAITSNSFQLGAHAELYIGVSAFNVYGWLGFDALFIFKPFSFIVDFTAGLALRSGTSTILGISLDGELSGPKPWHAVGNAHVTLLFFEISCHVDITWGGGADGADLPVVDAWPQLRSAIANVQNWSGGLPSGVPAPVTLATPKPDGASIYVDPSGVLTMRERVLPLDQLLTKFGEARPGPQAEFDLISDLGDGSKHSVLLGGVPVPFSIVRDKFAPAQFEEMSDQDKLSRPSFEDRDAGFSVGAGVLDFGNAQLGLDVAYVDVYVDDHAPPPAKRWFNPTLLQQLAWAGANGAAKSAMRATMLGKFAPPPKSDPLVALGREEFVIASTADLSQRLDITGPVTKGEAYGALSAYLASHPGDAGSLQIVPLYELAA